MSEYSPGELRRMEPATGLLVRGVRVDGLYMIVDSLKLTDEQKIEPVWFVGQGGPRAAIADFGGRRIKGSLSFALCVVADGTLDLAQAAVVLAAQHPENTCRMDTNHTLLTSLLVAESGASDYNERLSLNSLSFTSLKVRATKGGEGGISPVSVEAEFEGTVDFRSPSSLVAPPTTGLMRRQLSFGDCACSRFGSEMRAVMAFEVEVKSEVQFFGIIPPVTADNRDPVQTPSPDGSLEPNWSFRADEDKFFATAETTIGGSWEEMARLGADRESFVHGGYAWADGVSARDDLVLSFGPLRAEFRTPVYRPTEQPFGASLIVRTVRFFGQTSPRPKTTDDEILKVG